MERTRYYFLYDGYGPEKLAFCDGHNIPHVYSEGEWRRKYDHKFERLSTQLTPEEFEARREQVQAPPPPQIRYPGD